MSDPATWEQVEEWKQGSIQFRKNIRSRALAALAEAERDEKNEALSREASACDLLNTWARESSVEEAARPEELKPLADRLWAHWSQENHDLRTKAEAERDRADAWYERALRKQQEVDLEERENDQIRTENESLRGTLRQAGQLLRVARCPDTDCHKGAIPHGPDPDGNWEAQQCQWCYERDTTIKEALGDE